MSIIFKKLTKVPFEETTTLFQNVSVHQSFSNSYKINLKKIKPAAKFKN